MNTKTVVFLLPYLVAILVKCWLLLGDPRLMRSALANLSTIPKPANIQFRLDTDQQRVIVAYLTQVTVKSATVLTAFTSFVAALAVAFNDSSASSAAFSLVIIVIFGFVLALWVIPSGIPALVSKGWLGLQKGTWAVILSCAYDLILGYLAYSGLHRIPPAKM